MKFIVTEGGVISYTLWSCCFVHLSVLLSRQAPDDVTRSILAVGVPHVLRARPCARSMSVALERSVCLASSDQFFKRILVNFR